MKKKKWLIIGIVLALLVIGVILLFIFVDTSKAGYMNEMIQQVDEDQNDEKGQKMTKEAHDFINDHQGLFPTSNQKQAEKWVDIDVEGKDLEKNFDKQAGKMISIHGEVYDVAEVEWDGFEGVDNKMVTYVFVESDDGFRYEIFDLKENDIEKGDIVRVVALPLVYSNYNDQEGNSQRVFMSLASYIQKEENTDTNGIDNLDDVDW